jgi:hypothetical protein
VVAVMPADDLAPPPAWSDAAVALPASDQALVAALEQAATAAGAGAAESAPPPYTDQLF